MAMAVGKVHYDLTVRSVADSTLTGAMTDMKSGRSLTLMGGRVSGNVMT